MILDDFKINFSGQLKDDRGLPLISLIDWAGVRWFLLVQFRRIFKSSSDSEFQILEKELGLDVERKRLEQENVPLPLIERQLQALLASHLNKKESWQKIDSESLEILKLHHGVLKDLFPYPTAEGTYLVNEATALYLIGQSNDPLHKRYHKEVISTLVKKREPTINGENIEWLRGYVDIKEKVERVMEAAEMHACSNPTGVVQKYFETAYKETMGGIFKKTNSSSIAGFLKTLPLRDYSFNSRGLHSTCCAIWEENAYGDKAVNLRAVRCAKDNLNLYQNYKLEALSPARNIDEVARLFYEVFGKELGEKELQKGEI